MLPLSIFLKLFYTDCNILKQSKVNFFKKCFVNTFFVVFLSQIQKLQKPNCEKNQIHLDPARYIFKESVKIWRSQSSVCFRISTVILFSLQLQELNYSRVSTRLSFFCLFFKRIIQPPFLLRLSVQLILFIFYKRKC